MFRRYGKEVRRDWLGSESRDLFYFIPVAKLKLSEMKYFLKGCGVKLQRIIGAGEGNHVR